jgi:hypothetical protein
MRTIRRLYFYAVALISLEVVLWGVINLARSILCPKLLACSGLESILAQGLALVLVGVPVFGFHWIMAQRFARHEMDERASGIRAAFLYSVLLGTLIPVVQNFLALVNRPVLSGLQLQSSRAFVGGGQVWSDNVIAILMNLLVTVYFFSILRADWKVIQPKEAFANLRRIYRWVWTLYGLGLLVSGLDQLLRFIFSFNTGLMSQEFQRYWAVNGIVVTLVGAPIWVYAWQTIQKSLAEKEERESFLRLGLLYLLSLTGVIVTLSSGGTLVNYLLRLVFGQYGSFQEFVQAIDAPLALCIPFLGIWLYYAGWLGRAMQEDPDAPRRAGMRRLYSYILSAIGLGVTFVGMAMLLSFVVDVVVLNLYGSNALLLKLTAALALLIVGLPLWLLTWRLMQAEAFAADDAGDHARRSIIRKIYLYLALFVGVIGGMITAVVLLNIVLKALFAGDFSNVTRSVLNSLVILLLFIGLGLYHGLMLGRDGRNTASVLTAKHALFPVLIFDPGDGFGPAMLAAVQKQTPSLPAGLQLIGKVVAKEVDLPAFLSGTRDYLAESGIPPKAVILPASLALNPPESLREWLGKYNGSRLVVPLPAAGWVWVGSAKADLNQAALALRQLAEGQVLRTSGTPAWLIAVYIVAALVGLPILVSLIGTLISSFMR